MRYFEYLLRTHFKTVSEFCRVSGLNQSTVYAYMSCRRFPSLPIFMSFTELFGITAEDLWINWFREYSINEKK